MIGTIQQAKKSQSGSTLSIQIDGKWYTTRNWELQQAVNRRIIFEPSTQTFPDGGSCTWLNDYVFEDVGTTPADAAMSQAMAERPPSPPSMGSPAPAPGVSAQVPSKDRDASIVAQALTKACTGPGEPVTDVWTKYITLYQSYMSWKP